MTRILTYNEIATTDWQALVDRSPYATWFQTPEAYDFYASNPEEMMPYAYCIKRDGEIRALIVGYITKEKNALKRFFTRRAIIIGGPLISDNASDDDVEQLVRATIAELQSRAIYVEVRNFHDYSRWKEVFAKCGFAYQPHLNIQVTCDSKHSMSEQRIRQVKKALKNGAVICQAQSEQDVKDWYKILYALYRQKVRTPLWSEEFFLSFYRKGRGIYLLVKHQDKVIGGMMCPILNGKAMYEWYVCGLDELYKEQYASVMATYAAIEYAKANQIPLFDFMGAGIPNEPYGVRDFKMEFGGEVVEYGRYLYVRNPLLYWIGKMGVRCMRLLG